MRYALESNELLEYSRSISPYSHEQQQQLLEQDHFALSRTYSSLFLTGEMLEIRLPTETPLVAVPYLHDFVMYCESRMPDLELAAAFARTDQALMAIKETLEMFDQLHTQYAFKKEPEGRLTYNQAASILHIGRDEAKLLVDMLDIPYEIGHKAKPKAHHIAAADLGKLFKWHYPASFPIDRLDPAQN